MVWSGTQARRLSSWLRGRWLELPTAGRMERTLRLALGCSEAHDTVRSGTQIQLNSGSIAVISGPQPLLLRDCHGCGPDCTSRFTFSTSECSDSWRTVMMLLTGVHDGETLATPPSAPTSSTQSKSSRT